MVPLTAVFQRGDKMGTDDELAAVLDEIHAEMDAFPPSEWSLVDARRVRAALAQIRRSRNPVLNLACSATPRLRRRLGA